MEMKTYDVQLDDNICVRTPYGMVFLAVGSFGLYFNVYPNDRLDRVCKLTVEEVQDGQDRVQRLHH